MSAHLISLEYVRMAIKRAGWGLVNTRAAAVSTPHRPMRGRDGEPLHGACVIFPLN